MNPNFVRLISLFASCLFLCNAALSQNRTINGKVTDIKDGTPLTGVTLTVKGRGNATTTNNNGTFVLVVNEADSTIQVSHVGYENVEVQILGKANLNITLQATSSSLNEVFVIGYTSQRKKDLTGSVAVVDVSAIKAQPAASVAEALQGKAAGVNVVNDGSPGSTPQIRIRGYSTVNNNDPLYIIDGVPYQGKIAWLNQNDIQSMQVLKDASASSIYGSRANNGVIVITTKQGREGKPQITLDAYFGTSVPVESAFPKFMTPLQFAQYRYQSYVNAGLNPAASLGIMYGPGPDPVLPTYLIAGNKVGVNIVAADVDPSKYNYNPAQFYQITEANHEGTDWMKAITQNGPIQNYQLGATGGGKNTTYALSMGYLDQKGIVKHTSFKKYNVRSNVHVSSSNSRFKFGTNLLFSRTEGVGFATNTNNPGDYQQTYSPVGNVYKIQPIIPIYDIGGNFAGARGATLGDAKNPLAILERAKDNFTHENRMFGNIFGQVELIKNLSFNTSFGVDLFNTNSQNIRYPAMEDAVSISINGYGTSQGFGKQWTWSNTLNYKNQFGANHSLSLLGGTEAISNNFRTVSGSRDGYFILGDLNYYYLNTGTTNVTNAEIGGKNKLASIFARADYSFQNKYLFSATVRRDGSSNFGSDNTYAYFPAFSLAWRLTDERFLDNTEWIDDLKIRGGYGETGNQNIPANNAFDLFQQLNTTSFYAIGGNNVLVPGVSQTQIGNSALQWEKLKSVNVGVDFTLFKQAFDGSIDVYQKNTSEMLFPVPLLVQTAGMASSPFQNVGKMKNTGIEISLNYHYRPLNDKSPGFDLGVNFAKNNNTIKELAPGIERGIYGIGSLTTSILQVGHPYGAFFGYIQEGIFQNAGEVTASKQPGARIGGIKYADVNGDKTFSADDRTILGSPLPKFTYGINLSVDFRNFDLLCFFYGSQGNKIFNVTRQYTDFQNFPSAASVRLLNTWSPANPTSKIPSGSALATPLEYESSSYYIEDGSYFRLKNLQIGYNFKNIKFIGINKIRIYGSATNVFTITDYTGLDPEVSQYNTTFSLPGVDLGIYPNPRQFLVGLNVGF